MTNILITGGAGFIGSKLVNKLLKNPDCKVWVYDILHPQVHGTDPKMPEYNEQVVFVRGDIQDKKALQDVVHQSQPEVIFHLAAETGTGQSYDEVSRYSEVNVTGTANLVEALRSIDINCRIVLSSSRAVYGEGAYIDATGKIYYNLFRTEEKMFDGDFEVTIPVGATSPLKPVPCSADLQVSPSSVYAATKLMQEYLLTLASKGSKIEVAILRLQNVYGPGQSLKNPYTGVLSIFCQQLLDGQQLNIYEDGNIVRDFIYVDDVVAALIAAADTQTKIMDVIDIGLGQPVTILDAAKILIEELGVEPSAYKITGQFRIGDIRYAIADNSKANTILGWQPKVDIRTGLKNLAKWAKNTNNKSAVEE